jgi:hypothetical protein
MFFLLRYDEKFGLILPKISFISKLLDGRRQIGAKLEIKLRIREPLLHKQIQTSEHKWLIIDKFKTQSMAF